MLDRRVHRLTLWSAGLTSLPFVAALLVMGGAVSALVLLVVLAAVVGYSAPGLRLKERPVLDSLTSSTHFAGPAAFGLALAGAPLGLTAAAALMAFFLWGMASHAFGAVQDVQPDRAAGIGSIATVIGAARTVRLSLVLYAVAGAVMLLTGWPAGLAGLLALPYLVSIWPFRMLSDDRAEQANRGWRRFLWLNLMTGFLLTQLLIVIALRR